MGKYSDKAYLEHILDSIRSIENFLMSADRDRFDRERMVQNGFIRELEIIGEAARLISEEFRNRHTDVSWEKIQGMRNRLVHDYLGVDLKVVWDTVTNFIPELKRKIETMLIEFS